MPVARVVWEVQRDDVVVLDDAEARDYAEGVADEWRAKGYEVQIEVIEVRVEPVDLNGPECPRRAEARVWAGLV